MNEDNTIARILLQSKALKDFQEIYELSYFECIEKWVDECLKIYHEYDSTNKNQRLGLLILESATHYEFMEFKKLLKKKVIKLLFVILRN